MALRDALESPKLLAAASLLAAVAILALEVLTEDGLDLLEILLEVIELVLLVTAAAGVALLMVRLQAQHNERMTLAHELLAATIDGQAWRTQVQAHVDGLSGAIQHQFRSWEFTQAEAEVCLLLMKGLSHKQIGQARGTSEATVRHQARSAYEKSGLAGRAALCAFFLEELLSARNPKARAGAAMPTTTHAAPGPSRPP